VPERPLSQRDLAGRLASYETLFDISRMLLVSVTQDELFERISSELNRLVPVDALTIYRVDEVVRQIVPVHARDQWADEIMAAPLGLGQGLTGWVVEHGEPANITAAERDPRIAVVPGTPEEKLEEGIRRAKAYLAAGADCFYPIILGDLETLKKIHAAIQAPINVLAPTSAAGLAELEEAGIARVSLGPALMWAAMTTMKKVAEELQNYGSFDSFTRDMISGDEIKAFVRGEQMP